MKIYFKLLTAAFILLANNRGEICHEETGWCYVQSTSQAFYMFGSVTIGGEEVIPGEWEGNPPGECPFDGCDVIAAFNGETCVTWSYYYKVNDVFTLVLMGTDGITGGAENYLHNGDYPSFKIYQAETGFYFNGEIDGGIPMFYNFGNNNIDELKAEEDDSGTVLSSETINLLHEFNISDPYPNPFNASLKVDYFIPEFAGLILDVTDLQGRNLISQTIIPYQTGRNSIYLDMHNLPSGTYILSIHSDKFIKSSKIISLK